MDVLDRVIALQKRHVIRPVGDGDVVRCERDGIRVHPIKSGWRHDTPEMVALNKEAALVERVKADRAARPAQYQPIR